MLKSIRKHSKHPVAKIFLGLVLIAFAGLGLGSFVPSLQFNRDYIKAGDTSIEIQEIANQFNKLRSEVAPDLTINEAVTNLNPAQSNFFSCSCVPLCYDRWIRNQILHHHHISVCVGVLEPCDRINKPNVRQVP